MFTEKDSLIAANKVKLTKKQQDELLRKVCSGKESGAIKARVILKSRCKILVVAVMEKYLESGLSLVELAKFGEKGLDKAIDSWCSQEEKKRKYRFSVYASWFIREEIHKKIYLS